MEEFSLPVSRAGLLVAEVEIKGRNKYLLVDVAQSGVLPKRCLDIVPQFGIVVFGTGNAVKIDYVVTPGITEDALALLVVEVANFLECFPFAMARAMMPPVDVPATRSTLESQPGTSALSRSSSTTECRPQIPPPSRERDPVSRHCVPPISRLIRPNTTRIPPDTELLPVSSVCQLVKQFSTGASPNRHTSIEPACAT